MTDIRTDMAETTEKGPRKALKLSRPGRLELKKTVETGQVKQSFSHGRTKTVMVEVKRKRTYAPGAGGQMTEVKAQPELGLYKTEAPAQPVVAKGEVQEPVRELTQHERAVRIRALEEATKVAEFAAKESATRELEEALRVAREASVPVEENERSLEEGERRRREEEQERLKAEQESRRMAEDAAQRASEGEKRRQAASATAEEEAAGEAQRARAKSRAAAAAKPAARERGAARRRSGKLTISQALSEDGGRVRSVAAFRRRVEKVKRARTAQQAMPTQKIVREVVIPDAITVGELANRMAERSSEVVKALMKIGVMAVINQTIDQDTAELVVGEFGHKVRRVSAADVEIGLGGEPDEEDGALRPRPPVVTVMGHVDHGKTSLLDALRDTDVVSREAGGITQHIGAYQVELASGENITFIDTPGHEAFTAMRQRGAQVTDIVILVVAADDGVQPQTVEAINHAQAAGVPIIVAINKCDKPDADPSRVKNGLLSHEIVVEEMGGEVQCVEVSALEKHGLDKLAEAILLQAELLELKANPDRTAYGAVIEAKLERGRGPVATVLIGRGTLRPGDIFVAGSEWGRVRALIDDRGENVESAGPAQPVEVLGINGTPQAGDDFAVVDSEARAREVTEFRLSQLRDQRAAAGARGTLEQMFTKLAEGEAAEVPLVIKADVQGSVEAIAGALEKLATNEVAVRFLHAAVGGITESDVSLAGASAGLIIGFNVRANPQARDLAKRDNVEIRYYTVIYDVVDEVTALMTGQLAPRIEEEPIGAAEVRQVFSITKFGKIAGCMVREGLLRRGAKARLVRDSVVVHVGTLGTLKRFKDDVREVREGYECGASLENYNDVQVGDAIECFEVKEVARTL